jgi:hypothetical protein
MSGPMIGACKATSMVGTVDGATLKRGLERVPAVVVEPEVAAWKEP